MTDPLRPVERVPADGAISAAPQTHPPAVPPEQLPFGGDEPPHLQQVSPEPPRSLFRRRLRKFRRLRRGYGSFLLITIAYAYFRWP
jgi:hypothetical protein